MLSLFHIDKIGAREIICFGAGEHGQNFINNWNINFMEYNILYFADNNEEKCGQKLFGRKGEFYEKGIDIISAGDLVEICGKNPRILIVITTEHYSEIYAQLSEAKLQNDIISEKEFIAVMAGEFAEKYLIPFSNRVGFDITPVYQHSHGWGFIDGRTILFLRRALEYFYKGKDLCFLLSPPKTGNTTIAESARKCGMIIAGTHVLAGYYMFEDSSFRHFFNEFLPKIIIGVREPIAQYISLLFSQSDIGLIPMGETEWRDAQEIFNKIFVTQIGADDYLEMSAHNKNALENGLNMGYQNLLVDKFMDGQIKQWLGIDLYSYEFDKKKGYSVFKRKMKNGEMQQILFYKMEKMNEMENVFKEFLGLENFTLIQENIGDKKHYADLYQKFKDKFQIPKKFVDELYSSKFMKFCYEDAEIEGFREKWAKNIV